MDVLLLLVMIAILVGVFFVAIGKGGELAYEQADHAPLDLGPVSATDVALLRPPTALWGYNMQVTDEALDVIARALRDRDIEIAYLQRHLTDLGHEVPGSEEIERTPGFAPKHASSWPGGDAADPWSRLWTAAGASGKTGEAPVTDDSAVTAAAGNGEQQPPLETRADVEPRAQETRADETRPDETRPDETRAEETLAGGAQADDEPLADPRLAVPTSADEPLAGDLRAENLRAGNLRAEDPDDDALKTSDPDIEEQGW